MHRKHVINTVKKYLSNHFSGGWETSTSFRLFNTDLRPLKPQSVRGVYVGLLYTIIQFYNGSNFKVNNEMLYSLKITNTAITINGTPVAGDTIFMHCDIDATLTTTTQMTDVRIMPKPKVEYTVTGGGSD